MLLDWLIKNSTNLGDAMLALLLAMITYYIGRLLLRRIIVRAVQSAHRREWRETDITKRERTITGLVLVVWRVAVITVAAATILRLLFREVDLAPFFASAGVLSLAFAFGSQSLVKDFLSGIFIISENQYRVGDIVEIDKATGMVERIGTRSTVLRDLEGNVHYIPNGTIQHVVNKTMDWSMARFTISVATASNLEEIIKIINATGTSLMAEPAWKDKVVEAPAFVAVDKFSASTTDLIISGKTQPSAQWSVTFEMRRRLLDAFEHHKIKLG